MSTNREQALAAALQLGIKDADGVIAAAVKFSTFLNGAAEQPAAPTSKPVADTKPAAAKPAAAKPAAKPVEPVEEAPEAEGPTAEDIGKAINDLLAADKQDEALGALKKYGAKSKSTLKSSDYAAFLADAEKILLGA